MQAEALNRPLRWENIGLKPSMRRIPLVQSNRVEATPLNPNNGPWFRPRKILCHVKEIYHQVGPWKQLERTLIFTDAVTGLSSITVDPGSSGSLPGGWTVRMGRGYKLECTLSLGSLISRCVALRTREEIQPSGKDGVSSGGYDRAARRRFKNCQRV